MKEYQLEYLLAVVEMKNFTYAVKFLNITQPTLSKAISTLEEEIGFQLFVRNRGGIILTDEGVKFVAQAKNVVREMRELGNCISRIESNSSEIIVGINPLCGSVLIPAIEKKMAELNSEIVIHWIEDGTYGLEERLNNGSIDIAVLAKDYVNTEKFNTRSVCSMEEVLCVPLNHRLAGKKSVKADDLKDEKFVLFNERFNQDTIFNSLGLNPRNGSFTSQITTALDLVSVGKGVMLIHKPIYERYKDDYEIKALSLNPKMKLELVAGYKDNTNSRMNPIQETIEILEKIYD